MTNVIPFEPKAPTQTASLEGFDDMPNTTEPRPAFSFDMTQICRGGMVLIDACIPAPMATAFLEMLVAFQDGAEPSPAV